jgi:hypothetical protein
MSYSELFHLAIEHLCKKYLSEEPNEERADGRVEDRDEYQTENVSEVEKDISNAR